MNLKIYPVTLELAVEPRDVRLMVVAPLDVPAPDGQHCVVLGDQVPLRLGVPVNGLVLGELGRSRREQDVHGEVVVSGLLDWVGGPQAGDYAD